MTSARPRRGPQVEAVAHGGLPLEELERRGMRPADVLDFSVSVNPLGPSPNALRAAARADLGSYPDPNVGELRRAIAARHGLQASQVWVGNGASELLWLVAQAFLRPGEAALVLGPTYGEYRRVALLAGALVGEYWSPEAWGFVPSLDEVELLAAMQRTCVVFVCNPNNPTGVLLDRDAVDSLASLPGRPLVVLDEAFMSLTAAGWDSTPLLRHGNILVVRSMTKDHGVPGVRLGYALGTPEAIAAIRRVAPPWSVNAAAQSVGLAALEDEEHVVRGRRLIGEVETYLRRELATLGLTLRTSATNFWLVAVPDAAALRSALLDRGILVRDATSFGLPGHIRIGARPLDDCASLVAALSQVLPA